MYQIGEFSKIAQVSGRLLRYYDELDLLKPEHIDEQTGYRYYSASQLPQLNRILALKELGLTLDQIKRMVDDDVSPEELRGMLMMRKSQIEQMLQEEIARVRYIESRIDQINVEGNMENYDIVLKSVPAKKYLAVRKICSLQYGQQLAHQIHNTLPAKIDKRIQGHFMAMMHTDMFPDHEDDVDVAMGFLLEGKVDDNFSVQLSETLVMNVIDLPAEEHMLTITRLGHPRLGHGSYSALGVWAEANGYEFSGIAREVVINFTPPHRIDERVTEIQFPVRQKGGSFPQLS